MGHSIRESDGESFEDHGSGQEMTAASGPSTPLPFSLSFATPVILFIRSVCTLRLFLNFPVPLPSARINRGRGCGMLMSVSVSVSAQ